MNVLVLDANLQSALAMTRSLGKAGIRVICGAESKSAMASASRYCSRSFVYASPLDDRDAFIDDVRNIGDGEGSPLISALSDKTFLALFEGRNDLGDSVRQFIPENESIIKVFDKQETLAIASDIDVPIPHTVRLDSVEDANEYSGPFPVVVKPRQNVVWNNLNGIRQHVEMASNGKELRTIVTSMEEKSGILPILQEYIKGDEYGVFVLAESGNPKVWFAHERIRSLHASGGASVVRRSIAVPDDMRRWSQALLERLSWTGPAMVEFKRDVRSGEPILMEINGRFWGSLPLATASGVDFPLLWYRMARGEVVAPISYNEGIVSRHFLGDIHNLFSVFGSRRISGVSYPRRLTTLASFLIDSLNPRIHYDVMSLRDSRPFWAEVSNILFKT